MAKRLDKLQEKMAELYYIETHPIEAWERKHPFDQLTPWNKLLPGNKTEYLEFAAKVLSLKIDGTTHSTLFAGAVRELG